MGIMKKQRIDILIANSGLVESRNKARRLVMAGEVRVDGQLVHKSSDLFDPSCHIAIKSKPKYVSRGGLKLEKAITEFNINDIEGKICADIGASTGGFTDCLLQKGAEKVYAVDVGYGQLHQSLRKNPKVIGMERVNVKDVKDFPEPIDLVTIDVSFISLKRVFPIVKNWCKQKKTRVIALIKPQFEVGRKIAAKGKGVIRSDKDRQKVIKDVISTARDEGFVLLGVTESPIKGPKGNVEFLAYLIFDPLKNE
jgi:23S rRNA (cytidine1920-2'-O)/16S rRNA (cytidine1409-2'-O)-methyltransferase